MAKCVIIPSIAVSMLPDVVTITFTRISWDEFAVKLKECERITNYVRHKPTNDLLSAVVTRYETGFEYKIDVSDVLFLIALRTRAPTPGADVIVSPSDLLIYLAKPIESQ